MCVSFHGCSDSPAPSEDASAGDGGAYRLSIVEDKVVLASGSGRLGFYLTDEEGSFKGSEEDITVSLCLLHRCRHTTACTGRMPDFFRKGRIHSVNAS